MRSIIASALLASVAAVLVASASPLSDLSNYNYNPKAFVDQMVTVGNARFTVISPYVIRMEYSNNAQFEDRATLMAVNRFVSPPPNFTVTTAQNGGHTVTTIHTAGNVQLSYVNGAMFSASSLYGVASNGAQWSFGAVDTGNLFGTVKSLDELCTVTLNCSQNANMQIHEESLHCGWGVVSQLGWTTIDDTANYIMPSQPGSWFASSLRGTSQVDQYFFGHGLNFRQAITDYTTLAGKAAMPKKAMLGSWFTRWYDYDNGDVMRLIGLYEQYNLPLDVLVLDMNWHMKNDWTGFSWDRQLFPNPKSTTDYIHNKGLILGANIHDADGVGYWEEGYQAMCAVMAIDPKSNVAVPFQPLNNTYMHSLDDLIMKNLGIDFFWLDWQQGGTAGNCPGEQLNPTIITDHVRSTDSHRRGENSRDSILARWGGMGNHRYPVGFSGDVADLSWQCFAFQPYFSVTAANVAYGTISNDFVGPASDHELHVRWLQFGSYSPILRLHDRGMSAGGCYPDCPIVNLWKLPEAYFLPIRAAMLSRVALMPYIYTATRGAYDTGIALAYPLYYDFPTLQGAYSMGPDGTMAQYMFGSSILVAPVCTQVDQGTGLATKQIWLPPGLWWDDVFGQLVNVPSAGQTITQSYSLDEIPMFYKAGALIPRLPNPQQVGIAGQAFAAIDLYIYPGANSNTFTVYDDDGSTYNYQTTAGSSYTTYSYARSGPDALTVTIAAATGGAPLVPKRNIRIFLVSSQPVASASVNGGASLSYAPFAGAVNTFTYDGQTVTAMMDVGALSTTSTTTVSIKLIAPLVDADFALLKGYGMRTMLAKRSVDNFRLTPYSTTAGPGMVKMSAARAQFLSSLADPSNSQGLQLFSQLLGSNYTTLVSNALVELSSPTPTPAPQPPMTALIQLWDEDRQDTVLCGCTDCLVDNNYYAMLWIDGYQPLSQAQNADAVNLYDYWNGSDNWVDVMDTAPNGYGMATFVPNGYAFRNGAANHSCLQVWYNAQSGDHMTLALPKAVQWAQQNGYTQYETCIAYVAEVAGYDGSSRSHRRRSSLVATSQHREEEDRVMAWAASVMRAARESDLRNGINRRVLKQTQQQHQKKSKSSAINRKATVQQQQQRSRLAVGDTLGSIDPMAFATNLLSTILALQN